MMAGNLQGRKRLTVENKGSLLNHSFIFIVFFLFYSTIPCITLYNTMFRHHSRNSIDERFSIMYTNGSDVVTFGTTASSFCINFIRLSVLIVPFVREWLLPLTMSFLAVEWTLLEKNEIGGGGKFGIDVPGIKSMFKPIASEGTIGTRFSCC